jgi:protein tyrosine phosphatase (PTP) superfamily phosphohydrolase (DUF442 family)
MSIRFAWGVVGILALVLFAPGLVRTGVRGQASAPPASPGGVPATPPERVEVAGVENLFRLGPRLYSGGQPEGPAGFEALKRLGVRTIVSVDGARPDVEAARRLGLRYVHLPVGYGGIPRDQAVRLVKAMRDLPGPVFVHCHHGKHRGPAAAALCGMASEGWGRGQARAWLERAGTDPKYRGLFGSVEGFVPPTPEELGRVAPADLPERAEVPGLVEAMVKIDEHWDNLKAVEKAGFRTPEGHPDIDPPHEALLLAERYREQYRHEQARGEEFARLMAGAGRDATALEAVLRRYGEAPSPAARGEVEAAYSRAGRSCSACHARHRDDLRGR